VGDTTALPLDDDSVDAACANMVLHHAEDPAAMLTEMARVVRPGGVVAICDEVEHPWEWMREEHADIWLGFTPELSASDFVQDALQLGPGDILFMFTDGVTEAARGGDPRAGLFGVKPIISLLKRHARSPLTQLKHELLEELDRFTQQVYDDDVSFLALRARDEVTA